MTTIGHRHQMVDAIVKRNLRNGLSATYFTSRLGLLPTISQSLYSNYWRSSYRSVSSTCISRRSYAQGLENGSNLDRATEWNTHRLELNLAELEQICQ